MEIAYRVNPDLSSTDLDRLFAASWSGHQSPRDFRSALEHSLTVVSAYAGETLIGFVRLAWDGDIHAFLLDPTVHPAYRRRGVGRALVERAVASAGEHGIHWVHVDYEPRLRAFYRACSFSPTEAGLIHLR
jgi:ribosomal protein S18 acetylase RimI-like enzyme